jgi:uncharacterized protein YaiI (UPF0178 family)/DNA-directed RNA polymerase specialized sigma24 family protein
MNPVVTQPAAAPPDDPVRKALDDPAVREELLSHALAILGRRLADRPTADRIDKAEEAFQETYARALQKRDDYNPTLPVRPWLHGIMVNVLFEATRSLRHFPAQESAEAAEWERLAVDLTPTAADVVPARLDVAAYLANLPPEHREVLASALHISGVLTHANGLRGRRRLPGQGRGLQGRPALRPPREGRGQRPAASAQRPPHRGVVRPGFGAADDWIAQGAGQGDVVVTTDIPLAARCLEKGACVLGPKGEPFTEADIGSALAMRELMEQLRQSGNVIGGPIAMTPRDRSRFLSKLDETINAVRRKHPPGG